MGVWNRVNIRKALYYLRRNGIKNTWFAARERLAQGGDVKYTYTPPSREQMECQRKEAEGMTVSFSILVPAYRTPGPYLRELIESVLAQSYPKFELLIGDATEADDRSVEETAAAYQDKRIRYISIEENLGISENTNRILHQARGEYVGLLDHDDVLTPDALYEMACCIEKERRAGENPRLLYSDEDKCNEDGSCYYEPNRKEKFNLDLILSNNYICHFMVVERKLFQELKLRRDYDGAQDYDLVLRVASGLLQEEVRGGQAVEKVILHIPRVLYHWRCHSASTAENPRSKMYAYEAGRRALQDLADRLHWQAAAVHLKHVGFYRLEYEPSVLAVRTDVGAVGGKLIGKQRKSQSTGQKQAGREAEGVNAERTLEEMPQTTGKGRCIVGGRMSAEGEIYYQGLPAGYSGYLNRAALTQDGGAVDIRCIEVRPQCYAVFEQAVGVPYRTKAGTKLFDSSTLPEDADYVALSLTLCEALRREGFRILWDPEVICEV